MYDVITIGSATRDVFVRVNELKKFRTKKVQTGEAVCFPLGSKMGIDELHFSAGGGAVNTACTFANQELSVASVAAIGNDIRGKEILGALQNHHVNTDLMYVDPHELTAYSIIFSVGGDGERTIFRHQGAVWHLYEAPFAWNDIRAKWFYFNHIGDKSAPLLPSLIDIARAQGSRIAINPGRTQLAQGKNLLPLLKYADVFILNQEEASLITGIPFAQTKKIFRVLDELVKGIVVMTKGAKGVEVSDGKTYWSAGVFPFKTVVDRTGAGDAFGSGFISALFERSDDIEYAIRFASANATSTLSQWGATNGLLKRGDSIEKYGALKVEKKFL